MHCRRAVLVVSTALASVVASPPVFAQAKPPAAPAREVRDTYFGQTIIDPYRWMENEKDPELAGWLKAQNEYTRAVLDRVPGRQRLLQRIRELDHAGTQVSGVQAYAGRYFYYKVEPGAENRKLYVRDGLDGPERLLVDPEKLGDKGAHYSIDFFQASWDGSKVAYGLSPGGSEQSVMHVIDSASGKVMADEIDRCLYSYASWLPDNQSFFYFRMNKVAADAPASDRFKKIRTYVHALGRDPDSDPAIFGFGVSPRVNAGEDDFPVVLYSPATSYLFGLVGHGVKNEVTLYAAPYRELSGAATPWRKVADVDDEVTNFDFHGQRAYLLTHRGAPRFKIVRTDLEKPDPSHADVVVPTGAAVITWEGIAKDALYFKEMAGGVSWLGRVPLSGGPAERIRAPFEGAVTEVFTNPAEPGVWFAMTGWTRSPSWFYCDPAARSASDTRLVPPSPIDFSQIEAVEVKAPAADGTLVPLSIVSRRGLALDASHPTLLTGYGAYGISMEPYFTPTRLAWLERGGVMAIAHVRGGGEYGEDWHQGGMKATKQNTIGDFIACAEYLVAKFAARLQASTSSGKPVLLRVDYDAGHGIGSTRSQVDEQLADEHSFLLWQLGDPEFQPKEAMSAPASVR